FLGPGGVSPTFRLGPPTQSASSLVTHPAVQSELTLTEDQRQKITSALDPEAFRRARDEQSMALLSENQRARLKQLELQNAGTRGITRDEIAKDLQLSDEQRAAVKKIIDESNSNTPRSSAELSALARDGRSISQALIDLQKQADEKILTALTEE